MQSNVGKLFVAYYALDMIHDAFKSYKLSMQSNGGMLLVAYYVSNMKHGTFKG